MKKITFILAFVLCGFIGVQSQYSSIYTYLSSVENEFTAQRLSVLDVEDGTKFSIVGKVLTAKNLENGTQVDIYSVLGAKVYTFTYNGNPVVLNLNKGIYFIRANKYTQKIML
ncbi:MAG: T9SS type A sorting domain-containing protein [Porphyromonadaceae bacterium]|nr:T9SS type A sorting domain-containing protein [Porphyromonadaceae bacterium]